MLLPIASAVPYLLYLNATINLQKGLYRSPVCFLSSRTNDNVDSHPARLETRVTAIVTKQ